MVALRLENAEGTLDLSELEQADYGIQALKGGTGLFLPPKDVKLTDNWGDGATYRGRRVLPRQMDIPIYIRARSYSELQSYASRLAVMLADECRLVFSESRDSEWSTVVVHTGGGDVVSGVDTNHDNFLQSTITVTAPDPFWTSSNQQIAVIADQITVGFIANGASLANLKLSASQQIGSLFLANAGDVEAYPVWTIYGPGGTFTATAPNGDTFKWEGTLSSGDTLTIDTKTGLVVDQDGVNQFGLLDTSPIFWPVPPGGSSAAVTYVDTTPGVSKVTCVWSARRWVSI